MVFHSHGHVPYNKRTARELVARERLLTQPSTKETPMPGTIISKRCSHCKAVKPLSEFNRNRSCPDGLQHYCKECQRESGNRYTRSEKGRASRTAYERSAKGRALIREGCNRYGRSKKGQATATAYRRTERGKAAREQALATYLRRHSDRVNARTAVNRAIRLGRLPAPGNFLCKCGKPAAHYHHHLGYAAEHRLDVIPVCRDCHYAARNSASAVPAKEARREA